MIKPGGIENINSLISMGDFWADEFDIEDFDIDQWREIVRSYSIYVDHRCLCFYNDLNKPVGMLLGAMTRIPHSGRMIGQIHYVWLSPDHATDANLYQLHSEFATWAQGFNAQAITAPDFYPLTANYQRFFQDLGYETGLPVQIKGLA